MKKQIKIVSRFDSKNVLVCGKYESVKDCVEKNGADLSGADLYGEDLSGASLDRANLRGADLRRADLRGADLRRADLIGASLDRADLRGASLYGANLYGANLRGADLRGADLRGANLIGADLRGADLRGAKNYYDNHEFLFDVVKRNNEKFTVKELGKISQVYMSYWCWDKIRKIPSAQKILKKIADLGYDEYLKRFKGEI